MVDFGEYLETLKECQMRPRKLLVGTLGGLVLFFLFLVLYGSVSYHVF